MTRFSMADVDLICDVIVPGQRPHLTSVDAGPADRSADAGLAGRNLFLANCGVSVAEGPTGCDVFLANCDVLDHLSDISSRVLPSL
jgi:hypothetical protein